MQLSADLDRHGKISKPEHMTRAGQAISLGRRLSSSSTGKGTIALCGPISSSNADCTSCLDLNSFIRKLVSSTTIGFLDSMTKVLNGAVSR